MNHLKKNESYHQTDTLSITAWKQENIKYTKYIFNK